MQFTRLLGFRLFLIILGVMAAGTLAFTTVIVNWHSGEYLHNGVQSVARMSDVLKRSMHYSMLLNRREDIHQIITTVGNEPGIEVVRMYNKRGEITFSSRAGEAGTSADLRDPACSACHVNGGTLVTPAPIELTRIFTTRAGYRVLGMITPVHNDTSCSSASCHAHPASQTILGILDVMVPLKALDAGLADLRRVQYAGAGIMVSAVALVAGLFIWLTVNRPVRRLARGTEEIRKGNLRHRISVRTDDEVGALAGSFNHMADELQRAREELTEWNRTLEERVTEKTEELRRAQTNIVQMEKMVSLGTLAATVAHEINNPLEGVLTYAKLLKRKLAAQGLQQEAMGEIQSELSMIADETARCGNIVKNLLLFSRQKLGDFAEADLGAIIGRSLKLIDHHLKLHNVKLETDLRPELCSVACDAQQIEQALVALFINAVEAMPGGGTLRVGVKSGNGRISIEVQDTGAGIRDEDLPHIFEPFFTTKRDGKGTGLGLAVVYGIVQRHDGTIDVRSRVQQGTTFTMTLPTSPVTNLRGTL